MGSSAKIAISLPAHILDAIERERRRLRESRSAFVRRAVEAWLRREREREAVERYVRGYTEQPQTEEEFGWADDVTAETLSEAPWREAR